MAKQLSETELEKNIELCRKLIEKFPEPRRKLVKDLMDGPIGQEFCLAPASSRTDFHNCFPGGLLLHSLNLVSNLRKISTALCPDVFPLEKLIFVGLFHDFGKVGDGKEPFYIPNPSDWHRNKGMLYEVNKKCVYMPTSERGLFILQSHGIVMDSDEYLAIRLNDGMYTDENKGYRMKEPLLALLVHWADRYSAEQEKSETE